MRVASHSLGAAPPKLKARSTGATGMAFERGAESFSSALGLDHPRSQLKRGRVADVPPMSARELRDPVAVLVLVVTDDRALHVARVRRTRTETAHESIRSAARWADLRRG